MAVFLGRPNRKIAEYIKSKASPLSPRDGGVWRVMMVNGDYEEQSLILDKFLRSDSPQWKWSDVIPTTSRSNSMTYYSNTWEGRISDFRFAFGTAEYSLDSTVMFVDSSGTKALLNWAQDPSRFIDIKTDDYENVLWVGTTPTETGKKDIYMNYLWNPQEEDMLIWYSGSWGLGSTMTVFRGKKIVKFLKSGSTESYWLDFSKSTATHLEFTDGTVLDYYKGI